MRRLLVVWLTLGVLLSACGPAAELPTDGPTTQQAPDDVTPAPDFSLELGDGGTFTLSEEARPVFMVFWAEW